MRVCIPTNEPGGPDAPVADSFQESDLFDFYDLSDEGEYSMYVQIRNCAGMCKDDVETVVRRGAQAVIANMVTPNSLHRFSREGVEVYRALVGPSKDSLKALQTNRLARMGKIKT